MLHIEYQLNEDDFVAAAKLMLRKRRRAFFFLLLIPIMGAGMVAFSVLLLTTRSPGWGAFNLLYGALLLSYPLLRTRSIRRQYRKRPLLSKPFCMEADATEVHIISPDLDQRSSWAVYESFAENETSFLLIQQGRLQFVPIPKRCLDPGQIMELRAAVSAHMPQV